MSNGGLKLKVMPKFPSQVIGGAGIDVETANGNFTIGLDYADFMPPVAYDPNQTVLVWNQSTGLFQLVPLTA
ncbi:MAG: hypothetical protein J2P55_12665, partial [Rhizobiales bacterium]|nr:hypothetical protein [Hyphomicrobiales bacterium]